jgi:hypothetical protein
MVHGAGKGCGVRVQDKGRWGHASIVTLCPRLTPPLSFTIGSGAWWNLEGEGCHACWQGVVHWEEEEVGKKAAKPLASL